MARGRRTRFAPMPRRKRIWADTQVTDLGFAESSLRSNDLLSDFVSSGGSSQGVTVARTIVNLTWWTDTVSSVDNFLSVGLIKGTQSTADVADLVAEPYADWAYILTSFQGHDHGLVAIDTPMRVDIDTATKRKIDEVGETWWLQFSGGAPTAANETFSVKCRVRTLLLLP